MFRRSVLLAVAAIVGCGEDPAMPPAAPASIVQTGSASGTPGWLLDDPIAVKVLDDRGNPVADAVVTWQTNEEGAWLASTSSTTDSEGIAKVAFAPGWKLGLQTVRATANTFTVDASVTVGTLRLATVEGKSAANCGIDPEGRLWCWSHSPTRWPDQDPKRFNSGGRPFRVDPDRRYKDIEAVVPDNPLNFCGLTVANEMRCWTIPWQAFENGAPTSIESVPRNTPVPFVFLIAGDYGNGVQGSLCALDTDGRAWCRGNNRFGELGDGTRVDREEFQPVLGDVKFKKLSTSGPDYCGLDLDDHAWCWGGGYGEPVNVPIRMGGDHRYSEIGFSGSSSCGIELTTTKLYCWGSIGMDGIESDDATPRIEPHEIPGSINLVEIAGGGNLLGVFRLAGGQIGFAGDLFHFPGYNTFAGRVLTAPLSPSPVWRVPPRFSSLISKGSDTWCGIHQGGATLCAWGVSAPTGVPTPE